MGNGKGKKSLDMLGGRIMQISGIQKNSFIDYPGKIAAVIFTPGCNLNCFYCHNKILLSQNAYKNLLDTEEILKFLYDRKNFLDGVVISGGEPTLQARLEEFIQNVKRMGYPVKLDTNGINPHILKKLIDSKLLDYVAMDIKAPSYKYVDICRVETDIDKIQESIDLLMQGKVDYEFRTTFVPQLDDKDIICIAKRIKGARLYVLQQFRRQIEKSEKIDMHMCVSPHRSDYIRETAAKLKEIVKRCETRGC